MASTSSVQPSFTNISPTEFANLPENPLLIDVRSKFEYGMFHAPGAINLSLPRLLIGMIPGLNRWLYPIGGMNGMFAKLSIIELRSTQQVCGSQCNTFGCYKGTAETAIAFAEALPTEGQATGGCPLYSHPAQLQDNRDCMLCMTCLKGCPNRSAQLNLRSDRYFTTYHIYY